MEGKGRALVVVYAARHTENETGRERAREIAIVFIAFALCCRCTRLTFTWHEYRKEATAGEALERGRGALGQLFASSVLDSDSLPHCRLGRP